MLAGDAVPAGPSNSRDRTASLEKVIEHARLLDMDDLRAELAAMEGDMDAIDH